MEEKELEITAVLMLMFAKMVDVDTKTFVVNGKDVLNINN